MHARTHAHTQVRKDGVGPTQSVTKWMSGRRSGGDLGRDHRFAANEWAGGTGSARSPPVAAVNAIRGLLLAHSRVLLGWLISLTIGCKRRLSGWCTRMNLWSSRDSNELLRSRERGDCRGRVLRPGSCAPARLGRGTRSHRSVSLRCLPQRSHGSRDSRCSTRQRFALVCGCVDTARQPRHSSCDESHRFDT
jgi:hypothetical protein